MGNTGHKQVGTIWVNQPRLPAESGSSRALFGPLALSKSDSRLHAEHELSVVELQRRVHQGREESSRRTRLHRCLHVGPRCSTVAQRARTCTIGVRSVDWPITTCGTTSSAVAFTNCPFGEAKRFAIDNPVLNAVVGGWQVNGIANFRSGMPYTIGVANDLANVGTGNQRGERDRRPAAEARSADKQPPRTRSCGIFDARARHVRQSGAQHAAGIWHQQLGFLGGQEFSAALARRSVAAAAAIRVVQLLQSHAVLQSRVDGQCSRDFRHCHQHARSANSADRRKTLLVMANSYWSRRDLLRAALSLSAGALPAVAAQSTPAGRPPRLRITRHRIVHRARSRCRRGPTTYPVTRVHTDAGVTGTSFIGCPAELLERWVQPTLVGDDLFAVDRHLKRLQMQRGESGVQAWSGVEHAMWDAIGRACGRPVARILGGARDRLRVYRTCVFPGKQDQSDVPYETQAEFAVRLKNAGYTAMKIRAWRPQADGRCGGLPA